jgi:hypothetical protein
MAIGVVLAGLMGISRDLEKALTGVALTKMILIRHFVTMIVPMTKSPNAKSDACQFMSSLLGVQMPSALLQK